MATIPNAFYKVNGIYQQLPDTDDNNTRFTKATSQEVQNEISNYQSKTDSWSQNYIKGLQTQIAGGGQQYALDEQGVLNAAENLAKTQSNEAAVKAGTMKNVGTEQAPLYVPVGTNAPPPAAITPLASTPSMPSPQGTPAPT